MPHYIKSNASYNFKLNMPYVDTQNMLTICYNCYFYTVSALADRGTFRRSEPEQEIRIKATLKAGACEGNRGPHTRFDSVMMASARFTFARDNTNKLQPATARALRHSNSTVKFFRRKIRHCAPNAVSARSLVIYHL